MTKAMIMSLGGSPEPLKKSIETHKPELLIFLASHDSILAHGIRPVEERECRAIFETVAGFVNFNNPFDFPALP